MAEGGDFRRRPQASAVSKRDVFYENVRKELSEKDIRDILQRMLTTLQTGEENCRRLDEAKVLAGNNMGKFMILSYPIVAEAQIKILEDLKVGKGTKGLTDFCAEANRLSRVNQEVNRLFSEIRTIFLPPLRSKHLIKPENYRDVPAAATAVGFVGAEAQGAAGGVSADYDPVEFSSSLDLNS